MSQEANALYNEGYYYYTGRNGYPLNYRKAYEYFLKAAELGQSDAMYYLGVIYKEGKIIAKDYNKALSYFHKSYQANNKDPFPVYQIACMLYDGTGVQKDMIQAFKYFKIVFGIGPGASSNIYAYACFFMGCILINYYHNNKEAYKYLREAIQYEEIAVAYYNLGYIAEQENQDAFAIQYFKRAAELGYSDGMDSLGRMLLKIGKEQEAAMWIKKAADMGNALAQKRLRMLKVSKSGSIWDLFNL